MTAKSFLKMAAVALVTLYVANNFDTVGDLVGQ